MQDKREEARKLVEKLVNRYSGYPIPLVLSQILIALSYVVEEECCKKRLLEWMEIEERQAMEELEDW